MKKNLPKMKKIFPNFPKKSCSVFVLFRYFGKFLIVFGKFFGPFWEVLGSFGNFWEVF